MARGGYRKNAPLFKPTWHLGETKTMRVPVALAQLLLALARELDRCWHESKSQNLSASEARRLTRDRIGPIIDRCLDELELVPFTTDKIQDNTENMQVHQ
ncbi:MAG: hypothetical protein AB4352_14660 [Hormoscilla sp.]